MILLDAFPAAWSRGLLSPLSGLLTVNEGRL